MALALNGKVIRPSRLHRIVLQEPTGASTDIKAPLFSGDEWRLLLFPFHVAGEMDIARIAFWLRSGAASSFVTVGLYRITNAPQIDETMRDVAGLQLRNLHKPALEASLIARGGSVQMPAGTGNTRLCVFDLDMERRLTADNGPFAVGFYSEQIDIAFPYILAGFSMHPMHRTGYVATRPDALPDEVTCLPPALATVIIGPVGCVRSRLGVRMHPLIGAGGALV